MSAEPKADPRQVADFKRQNAKYPVIAGAVIGDGGKGCLYTLKSGRIFKLNRAECAAIGEPRWDLQEQSA